MAVEVIMPRLDMTTEEMTILRWMKGEGEPVQKGEPLLEVMTEKVAIEIDAPADGFVKGIRFGADEVVPVGEVIAYIAEEDEAVPTPGDSPEPEAAATPAAAPEAASAPDPSPEPAPAAAPSSPATPGEPPELDPDRPVRAAPAVRRLAADLGVDLRQVRGSGVGGRVLADDVRAFAKAAEAAEPTSASAPAVSAAAPVAVPDTERAERVSAPLSATRRIIARRMSASWQSAPQVTLTMDVDMHASAAFRDKLRQALTDEGQDVRLTWNSFVAWVAVQALVRRPELNATLEDDVIHTHSDVDLGVAMDAPAGLVVPVIPAAQRLRPSQLAAELAKATEKAREGTLQPADVAGGTFTITNLGGFGIGAFTPILNPPQVAILGVGAITEQIIPVNGEAAVRPVCTFSLTFDHRAVDGADGARYLAVLKELLLDPYRLVV